MNSVSFEILSDAIEASNHNINNVFETFSHPIEASNHSINNVFEWSYHLSGRYPFLEMLNDCCLISQDECRRCYNKCTHAGNEIFVQVEVFISVVDWVEGIN